MARYSLKRAAVSVLLVMVMLVTPVLLGGCKDGIDGKDGKTYYTHVRYAYDENGTGISTEPGDRTYISILTTQKDKPAAADFTVWVKFVGDPGANGENGSNGASAYTYIAYASDTSGNGFSLTHAEGLDYIAIISTDTEIKPLTKDAFTGKWVKFVGKNGASGGSSVGSYIYIAYASDKNGTGFSTEHTDGLDYIGIITTSSEIVSLTKDNFTGRWIKFVGEDGKDGVAPYIGYDGYWWSGDERTEQKFTEVMGTYTMESSIGIVGNKYFEGYSIDMGQNKVALMSNYFSLIGKSAYSGTPINEIQIYAEQAGTLTVSTASVQQIAGRAAGSNIALKSVKKVTLTAGLNTVNLDGFTVPSGETLVLGNTGDTAKLAAYKGVKAEDEHGLFTVLSETGIYKTTDGFKDKLAIKVEKAFEYEAFSGMKDYLASLTGVGSDWKHCKTGNFTHTVRTNYAGKTVDHIDVLAYEVKSGAASNDVYMSVKLVKQGTPTLVKTYKFYASEADVAAGIAGKTITVTCSETLTVGADETLVFGDSNDTLRWSYKTDFDNTLTGGYIGVSVGSSFGTITPTGILGINVYYKDTKTLKDIIAGFSLAGRKISVIGDSISTYDGYSNNAAANSTTAGNKVFYGTSTSQNVSNKSLSVNDTWWMQAINQNNLELVVNNSFSGSWVTDQRANAAASNYRAENLDSDAGVKPDIIAAYIGINDLAGDGTPRPCGSTFDSAFFARVESGSFTNTATNGTYTYTKQFDEGYALMIYKMKKDNPNADIFCFTIPKANNRDTDLRYTYNNAIRAIAAHYGCTVVELDGTVLSNNYSSRDYTFDNLHPTALGHDIMTEQFNNALKTRFLP